MKILSDINDFIRKTSKNRNMNINTLIAYIAIGILLIVTANLFFGTKYEQSQLSKIETAPKDDGYLSMNYTESIEKQLKNILSKIEGVGTVDVMITLSTEKQVIPAFNNDETKRTTEEKDSGGGTRIITEQTVNKEVVVLNENGKDKPFIAQEIRPRINGVLVVAEGAVDPTICGNIMRAVETTLNLPIYKIMVLPRKK